ncbi:ATP-dependent helicase HrpB [Afifella sp. IM 167]|uniref:ATP-dependent helicase HrpB n=1 Tax=Afifella sp. IM 167 TaxID=2033586 RepID=UPI001CCD6C16|nr:ATP-dependent helicase HrpB [Afifella sp. IM 167]MBZ8133915.1 ATP-dependent helicase HrpB [Afifella sp. IM 167]
MSGPLPVEEALPALFAALEEKGAAVLIAPTGAGKTTRVPLALLESGMLTGEDRIVVVEPRRLAARAAAARMARERGEEVGKTVGYRVRMEARVSRQTRIELVTAGVFLRMIGEDPELSGIGAILFDEVHERSLDADLAMALALDARAGLRPDLKLAAMSATVDGARFAALLGDAPVVESAGRLFPVDTRYLGSEPGRRIEERMARAIARALAEEEGSLLAFLPGQGEIRRLAERLAPALPQGAELAPLYGAMELKDQDRAIRPAPAGRRKIVLATSIAETSLTIEGVNIVVDSGLTRRPHYDPGSGLTRLETVRVSRAAADQRKGRAGRTAPGVCYRLWDEPQNAGLAPFDRPEILEAELSALALALLSWGVTDPAALAWLDPPPAAAFAEAKELLSRLGALDAKGLLTAHGRALASFPLAPRLAHMIIAAAARGAEDAAAEIAALVSEPGLAGRDSDLRHRLETFRAARSGRIAKARQAAKGWARLGREAAGRSREGRGGEDGPASPGALVALAFPERVAKSRGPGGRFLMASGRGAYCEEADPLAGEPFLAVAELSGGGADSRILLAAPLERAEIEAALPLAEAEELSYDAAADRIVARRVRRLGAIELSAERLARFDREKAAALLTDAALARGVESLPWPDETLSLRARIAFLRRHEGEAWPDLSDEALSDRAGEWLTPALSAKKALADLRPGELKNALAALLPWAKMADLDRLAPAEFAAPSGRRLAIDYAGGEPTVAVSPQNLFSLAEHPAVLAGRVPLTFSLLSPAGRPIQLTRDLPGFWRGSWREVRAEMRGRYPKHDWPEDPVSATPATGAKRRKA